MSKKDKTQVVEPQVAESQFVEPKAMAATPKAESEAEKLEKFKAAKKAAAKRFKERRAQEKVNRIEGAKKLIDVMKRDGIWDKLDDECKGFVNGLANPVSAAGNGTESVFTKLFGANPAVGASFTLSDAFNKTLKGKANIDHLVKKWSEKGIVVSFKKNDNNILDSVYTLEATGN